MFLNKIRNIFVSATNVARAGKHLCRQQCVHNNVSSFASTFRLPSLKRNLGKQRTAYHAVNDDFNSLSQVIRESANVNTFRRHFLKK